MPFDGAAFLPRKPQPARPAVNEKLLAAVLLVLAFTLLVLPVSLDGMVDFIRYLQAR